MSFLSTSSDVPGLRKPKCEISIGSADLDKLVQSLSQVTVKRALGPDIDCVELLFYGDEGLAAIALDDEATVSFGYEDGEISTTFTGSVVNITYNLTNHILVTLGNGSFVLSRTRINTNYEQQKTGDIITDLASQANITVASTEDGIEYPYYIVDDGISVYTHLSELAQKSGCVLYIDNDGGLVCEKMVTSSPVHTYTYALDIIQIIPSQSVGMIDGYEITGDGAASINGKEAWGGMIKDISSVQATAGEGSLIKKIYDPSIRSTEAATLMADSLYKQSQQKTASSKIIALGSELVTVGSTIEVVDTPIDQYNGNFYVTCVNHVLSKQTGFISTVHFCKVSE